MWLMLQSDVPDDYICATGVPHTVRELCEYVFTKLGLNYRDYVVQDSKYYRPVDVNYLKGDSSKLINKLGWKREYTFETMLDEMVEFWINKYSTTS
jgi:GDPmannose 4,6-dehydratase